VTLDHHHDLISTLEDPLHLEGPRVECLPLVLDDRLDRVTASMGSRIRPSLKRDFEVRVCKAEGGIPVAVVG
jgi:hypothetical protein